MASFGRIPNAAGIEALHVPFKGTAESVLEIVAGRVDFVCTGLLSAMPFLRDGRLIALAVSTSKRSPALPDVPTTLEAGFRDSDYLFWNGMFVPVKTLRPLVERPHKEVQLALAQQSVKDNHAPTGVEPMPLTPAEYDALVRSEIQSNFAVVKAANLKFE